MFRYSGQFYSHESRVAQSLLLSIIVLFVHVKRWWFFFGVNFLFLQVFRFFDTYRHFVIKFSSYMHVIQLLSTPESVLLNNLLGE